MKKVAIVHRMDEPGGVQSCIVSLIKALNEKGVVPVLLWDTKPLGRILEENGLKITSQILSFPFSSSFISRFPCFLRKLFKTFNIIRTSQLDVKYDFIYSFYNGFIVDDYTPHVYYLSGPPLLPQLEVPCRGVRGVPRRMVDFLYHRFLAKRYPAYECHKNCRYVINSRFTASLFMEAHGIELPVVYPPIRLRHERFVFSDWKKRKTIVFFSRIVDYKRPEMVIKLAQRFSRFQYVIMGGVSRNRLGYFDKLKKLVGSLQLDNVRLIANPSDAQVLEVFRDAKYYIFPAVDEHFGMTTPEAIDQGAVPFVHDSGGQREIVPVEELRFDDLHFIARFKKVLSLGDQEGFNILQNLKRHIYDYDEKIYQSRMLRAACLD
jgi:glycosyltransferase involved in cell wall biosynthesis